MITAVFSDKFRRGAVGRHANERVANSRRRPLATAPHERRRPIMKDDTREENEKRRERKRTTDSGGWYTYPCIRDPSRYGNKRVRHMPPYVEIYLKRSTDRLFSSCISSTIYRRRRNSVDIKMFLFLFIRWRDRFFQPFR